MKILEKKDYTAWRHQFACTCCESKLEAEPADLRARYTERDSGPCDGTGMVGYWTYKVRCAVCSQEHTVLEHLLPKVLQHEVQERSKRQSTSYFDR